MTTEMTSHMQIEGRLNAYRRLLIGLATELARHDSGRAALEAMLADAEIVDTQEEDPGVLPDAAFAGQELATEEMRTVLTAALARRDALDAHPQTLRSVDDTALTATPGSGTPGSGTKTSVTTGQEAAE